MKVPKLRFKNDDGLGFSEWEEKKLGDIVDVMQSGVSRMLSDADIGLPVIRSNNLINNKLDISDIKYWHTQDNQGVNLENYFLKEGDLLVNFINSLAQIGKIALFENKLNRNTIFTTNLMRLSFGKNISSKYISCFFQTNNYINYIQAITKPAVNQASFTTKEFKALPIPLPSLPEQTKIANFLTAIDEKITQLTQKCDLLAQYKKGVMQQIFSQKLRFKSDDGREFPEWGERKLDDIAQIVGGGTPETGIKEYWNGNIQWFTPTELKSKYATKSQRTITELGLRNSSARILPVGTLLFSSRATVGDVSIALNPCTTNQGFQSLIVNDQNNNEFIYYWILNNKKAFLEKASGSTFLEVSKKEIEKLSIQLPVLKEQTKIANFLTAIDDKITQAQTQLDAVKRYKKGLLQQMFV